ncbi:MAG TPA: hypothetical protein ENI87_08185 [bacterium]|nr:hypothetical protein [bacterium]
MSESLLGIAVGLLASLAPASVVVAQDEARSQQPPELGTVHWLRNERVAQEAAKQSRKPLLVLFQEVPG